MLLSPAVAAASDQVSSNWAGYVAGPGHTGTKAFTSVSGTWIVPKTTCTAGEQSYSAVWVGLGGYHENARGLEQLGTEEDCDREGAASYAAWLEMLPAAPVGIHVHVHPGDTVTASTTVAGHAVTFRLRDLTAGTRFSTTRHTTSTDLSTAEWIVEAPSVCESSGSCSALPLARIGTVEFASATATSARLTRAAGDTLWSNAVLELEQASLSSPIDAERRAPEQTVVSATPSAIAGAYGAFSVALTEQTSRLRVPKGPTLPSFRSG